MIAAFSLPPHQIVRSSVPPSSINYKLTIITVVKDDPVGLRKTLDSLKHIVRIVSGLLFGLVLSLTI